MSQLKPDSGLQVYDGVIWRYSNKLQWLKIDNQDSRASSGHVHVYNISHKWSERANKFEITIHSYSAGIQPTDPPVYTRNWHKNISCGRVISLDQ